MHYLIKQDKCGCTDGRIGLHPPDRPNEIQWTICPKGCVNGVLETRVDADEWLREKLREFADEK